MLEKLKEIRELLKTDGINSKELAVVELDYLIDYLQSGCVKDE